MNEPTDRLPPPSDASPSDAPPPLATFGLRALAKLADLVVLNVVATLFFCAYAVLGAFGLSATALIPWLAGLFSLFCVAYFAWGTSGGRQTLGYRLAGLQVALAEERQTPAGVGLCLGRSLINSFFLALSNYGIGLVDYLPIAVTPSKRALHDLIAGTQVIVPGRPRFIALGLSAVGAVLVPAAAVFLVIKPYFLQTFYTPSPSMAPTIAVSDHFLVNKFYYIRNSPRRGDIIAFRVPASVASYFPSGGDTEFVKRIVGLPGDEVRMSHGKVFLYGRATPLPEPFVAEGYRQDVPKKGSKDDQDDWFLRRRTSLVQHVGEWWIKVPPGQYFVLGDDRNDSNDSHIWGFLPQRNIVGKVTMKTSPQIYDL